MYRFLSSKVTQTHFLHCKLHFGTPMFSSVERKDPSQMHCSGLLIKHVKPAPGSFNLDHTALTSKQMSEQDRKGRLKFRDRGYNR